MVNCISHRSWILIIFAVVAGFLIWGTTITNHTEAEDAYEYARAVEDYNYNQLYHPHHRIYHPLGKWIYELSGATKSFGVLQVFSGICSSLTLVLFYQLLKRLNPECFLGNIFYTSALMVTYGFWRYSREVEVYPLMWLSILCSLHVFLLLKNKRHNWLVYALVILVATTVHSSLAPILVAPVGILLLKDSQNLWKLPLFCILLVGGYFGVEKVFSSQLQDEWITELRGGAEETFGSRQRSQAVPKLKIQLSSIPKAAIGSGACLIASAPIMSFDSVYHLLETRIFPYRQLSEERFFVENLPYLWKWVWLILMILTVIVLCLYCCLALFRRRLKDVLADKNTLFIISGFTAYVGLIFLFEPGNPEMWLTGLPLFWLAVSVLLPRPKKIWIGIVLLMVGTNYLGGIGLLGDPERDYNRATSAHALNAIEGDLYLTDQNAGVHGRFISYTSEAKLLRLTGEEPERDALRERLSKALASGNKIFIHRSALNKAIVDETFADELNADFVLDEYSQGATLFRGVK